MVEWSSGLVAQCAAQDVGCLAAVAILMGAFAMAMLKHVDFEVPGWGEWAQGPVVQRGYEAAVLALDPLAYWRLGEAAGAAAQDRGALGLHGSYLGGVMRGEPGALVRDADAAVRFDGSSGYVDCHNTDLLNGAAACTILFWMNHTGAVTKDGGIVGRYKPGGGVGVSEGWVVWVDDAAFDSGRTNTVSFGIDAVGGAANVGDQRIEGSTDLVTPGQWDFYACVYEAGVRQELYQNGVLDRSRVPGGGAILATAHPLFLANTASTNIKHLSAGLDEVAVFDRALAGDEIAALYRRGRGILRLSA